jgi:hypothetical protein
LGLFFHPGTQDNGSVSLLWHGVPDVESSWPERRAAGVRYQAELELHYRVLDGSRRSRTGSGRTINLSLGGVLFHADSQLAAGTPVQLAISWPRRLAEVCPLLLLVTGRILRAEGARLALKTDRLEFRTHGSPSFHESGEVPRFRRYF